MQTSYQIVIQLQIKLEIALFCKLQYFKYIVQIKIMLWCAIFAGLWFTERFTVVETKQ